MVAWILDRYYTCYNHIKYKSCERAQHMVPAELIEELLRILKSPEIVMDLNRLAEMRKDVSKTDLMTAESQQSLELFIQNGATKNCLYVG